MSKVKLAKKLWENSPEGIGSGRAVIIVYTVRTEDSVYTANYTMTATCIQDIVETLESLEKKPDFFMFIDEYLETIGQIGDTIPLVDKCLITGKKRYASVIEVPK